MSTVLSMDKNWKFSVYNPNEELPYKYPKMIDFYRLKSSYEDGYASVNFDDSDWRSVDLPHDAVVESDFDPDESIYHGGRTRQWYCYRKTFSMDECYAGSQFLICFGGIACNSRIYFNGSLIRHSFSADEEITLDVSDRMHFGKQANVIVVIADATAFDGWSYEGGGIYRHVDLYIKNPLHISHNGVFFNPVPVDDNRLNAIWKVLTEISIENIAYEDTVCDMEIIISDEQGNVAANTKIKSIKCYSDRKTVVKTEIEINNPILWDIESPVLYNAETRLMIDDAQTDSSVIKIGFRHFSFDSGNGFILNGRHIKIKGFGVHMDHAGVGVALPDAVCDYRIRLLKETGCNTYRCAHRQHSKEIMDACDRYGLIVMNEVRHFETSEENLSLIDNFVLRDRNHPSLMFYTLFNEEPLQGSSEGSNIFKRMRSRIEQLDDSRIVFGGMNGGWFEEDGVATVMNVTGFNYSIDKIPDFHKKYPKQPIMITECVSTTATRGCYKTDPEKHIMNSMESEKSYHADVLTACKMADKYPYILGMISWAGFDYRGEPTPYIDYQISSQYGIMDTCGFPKTNYYYAKSCFSESPMIWIEPHWNHNKGETVKVKVITNSKEAELFLNEISLGRKEVDRYNPPIWEVPFVAGVISAVGYLENGETISCKRETAGKPYALRLLPDRSNIADNGNDAVVINVCAVDEKGIVVPNCNELVHFNIEGQGRVIGVGNGDPNSREADKSDFRRLYCGYAQVIVQAEEKAESVLLSATSEGLISDSVKFDIKHLEEIARVSETDSKSLGGLFISLKDFDKEPPTDLYLTGKEYSLLENAFEPLVLNPNRYQKYENCYKIYRTKIQLKNSNVKKCEIYVEKVQFQSIKVYANGRLVFETEVMENEPLRFSFDTDGKTCIELRFHIQAREGRGDSGLRGFATLSVE